MLRYNCATELKLIFTVLLLFGSVATLLPFLPTRFSPFPTTNVTSCLTTSISPSTTTTTTPPPLPQQLSDQVLNNGVIKRSFYPIGTAAYNFVFMSAYRGSPNTFSVIGLSSKPLHDYGHPTYTCEYQSNNSNKNNGSHFVVVPGYKIPIQDFGYARMYIIVVVNCTFPTETDSITGGRLLLHASTDGGDSTDTIIALTEPPNSWHPSQFNSPPKYDYLYCGSSLFGNLSPQRIREWIAYHVRLFGKKSHFVFHDAGGIHPEVFEVLNPWIELGFVTVHDIMDQEQFDTFYHNQILVLNDCLHRHRFVTKWMFFFDVDEYIYLPGDSNSNLNSSLDSIMELLNDYTLFNFEQVTMSDRLCLAEDAGTFQEYVFFHLPFFSSYSFRYLIFLHCPISIILIHLENFRP